MGAATTTRARVRTRRELRGVIGRECEWERRGDGKRDEQSTPHPTGLPHKANQPSTDGFYPPWW